MLHALTTYYNPVGYQRLRDNYRRFRDALRGCELHTIELSFTGEFEIPDAIHLTGGPQNLMWQKERMLNLLASTLPPDVDRLAWVDCDLLFCNPHWAEQAYEALDTVKVVQLYSNVHFLNRHHNISKSNPSYVRSIGDVALSNRLVSPGGAWAAKREVFPLIDIGVCGGADKMLVEAWRKGWRSLASHMNVLWAKAYIEDGMRQHDIVQGTMGHLRGDIIHCWHGDLENRHYTSRWKNLTDYQFDPRTDIELDGNGLWRWATNKPEMHAAVANYFKERQEDG